MGCGCKNKGNENPQPQQVNQIQQHQNLQQKNPNINEDIKTSIKKTVEKYYNINKNNK